MIDAPLDLSNTTLIPSFAVKCKLWECSLTPTKKKSVLTLKWDYDDFTKLNPKWNLKILVYTNWNQNGVWTKSRETFTWFTMA